MAAARLPAAFSTAADDHARERRRPRHALSIEPAPDTPRLGDASAPPLPARPRSTRRGRAPRTNAVVARRNCTCIKKLRLSGAPVAIEDLERASTIARVELRLGAPHHRLPVLHEKAAHRPLIHRLAQVRPGRPRIVVGERDVHHRRRPQVHDDVEVVALLGLGQQLRRPAGLTAQVAHVVERVHREELGVGVPARPVVRVLLVRGVEEPVRLPPPPAQEETDGVRPAKERVALGVAPPLDESARDLPSRRARACPRPPPSLARWAASRLAARTTWLRSPTRSARRRWRETASTRRG